MYKKVWKRLFDFLFSAGLILLLSPLMVLVLLASALITGFRPFFFQQRSGRNGIPFHIFKFKTLDNEGNVYGMYGRFLRASSLDELPQLFNILLGQMSLVGPRPLYPEYDQYYSEEHCKRLDVKPGLTGLAQISGRNALGWKERFDLDVHYVADVSFVGDMRILIKTAVKVFQTSGADGVDLEPFRGYN